MPASGTNVVFFGTEDFSLSALSALVDAGYSVAIVVTKPDRPSGRGLKVREPIVKAYAREHGIPIAQPERLSDIDDLISAVPDRIGVLSSYGKIIPDATLHLFMRGIINVHPSLLPKYRGPSPIETAIVNGDTETGVSIMRLVSAMDAGPVYMQKTVAIGAAEGADALYKKCAQHGSALLCDILPSVINGSLEPTSQDESAASYTRLLNKKDSIVDPNQQTAESIARHVRAYELYPRTRMIINDKDAIVTKAHVSQSGAPGLTLVCQDETFITIDELVAPSGKKITGTEFVRGYMN